MPRHSKRVKRATSAGSLCEQFMFYVYILNSILDSDRMYVGITNDLENRLREHNAGESIHTNKYKPWKLMSYIAFDDKEKAVAFERYLKSGSGRSFAKRHL